MSCSTADDLILDVVKELKKTGQSLQLEELFPHNPEASCLSKRKRRNDVSKSKAKRAGSHERGDGTPIRAEIAATEVRQTKHKGKSRRKHLDVERVRHSHSRKHKAETKGHRRSSGKKSHKRSRKDRRKSKIHESSLQENSPPLSNSCALATKQSNADSDEDLLFKEKPYPQVKALPMDEYLKFHGYNDKGQKVDKPLSKAKIGQKLAEATRKCEVLSDPDGVTPLRKDAVLKKSHTSVDFVPRNLKVKSDSADRKRPKLVAATDSPVKLQGDVRNDIPQPSTSQYPSSTWEPAKSPEVPANKVASVDENDSSSLLDVEVLFFNKGSKTTASALNSADDLDFTASSSLCLPTKSSKITIGLGPKATTAPSDDTSVGDSSQRACSIAESLQQPAKLKPIFHCEEGEIVPSGSERGDSSDERTASDDSEGECKESDDDSVASTSKANKKSDDATKPVKRTASLKSAREKTKAETKSSSKSDGKSTERKKSDSRSRQTSSSRRRSRSPKRRKRRSSRSSSASRTRHRSTRLRSRSRSRERPFKPYGPRYRESLKEGRYHSRRRSCSPRRRRSRDRTPSEERIDHQKLYEIASRNVSAMLQSGSLQQVYKMSSADMAKLRAGGQSVEQLVEYCKKLQKKQEEAARRNAGSSDDEPNHPAEDDADVIFHHPFALKPSTGPLVLNIPGAVPLPIKTPGERAKEETQLRLTFPVSSGEQHRQKEGEWTPVEKEVLSLGLEAPEVPKAIMPAPAPPPKPVVTTVFPESAMSGAEPTNISDVITQRIQAIKRLQTNPNDCEALKLMHSSEEKMNNWAESKVVPGQFTGSTGVQILTPAELAPQFSTWVRKDHLASTKPVDGGMGMVLLQKMGWRPGEGLGKTKSGNTLPLTMEIKNDRKGLVSVEEMPTSIRKPAVPLMKDLASKHPVSALTELCSKRKWGPPSFDCIDTGRAGGRFLWRVIVNGVEYQPMSGSNNKKTSKAEAAQVALQSLGLVPRDPNLPFVL